MNTLTFRSCRLALAALTALLIFAALPPHLAAQGSAAAEEQKLLATLQSASAELHDKGVACRRLAVIGSKASVPVLAALLPDEKLSHMARYALEPNPDLSAAQALRDAVGKLGGNLKIGVINSLGARRDATSVGPFTALLADADASIAAAAAGALARIANADAARALQSALAKAAPALRPALGDAALTCATTLLAEKKPRPAQALFDALREGDFPPQVKHGALRGGILVRGNEGVTLLVEQLRSPDAERFALGLRVARELPGADASRKIGAVLAQLPAERQAQLLEALGDRGDAAALAVILPAVKSGPTPTRVAALRAAARVHDASAVKALLEAATAAEPEVSQAAQSALASLPAPAADQAILASLDSPDANLRRAALEAAQARGTPSAAPKLLTAARDADPATRRAALKALGETTDLSGLPGLLKLLQETKAEDRAAVGAALSATCRRVSDKNACADQLLAALPAAGAEVKAHLLEALGETAAPKALPALRAALGDASAEVKAAALGALAAWPDLAVAPDLLGIARTATENSQRNPAFLGLVRLGAEADAPPAARCKVLEDTLALARDAGEKKRVLGALGAVPTADALRLTLAQLGTAELANEAGAAIVRIAGKLGDGDRAAADDALDKVIASSASNEVKESARRASRRLNRQSR